jgi:ABC-type nitrate/sulfonate/bicarbonate transport system permease component
MGKRTSGILLVLVLLGIWEASARLGWVVSTNWPPFSEIAEEMVRGLVSGDLLGVLAASMGRMMAGYLIGGACGILLGLVLGTVRALDRFVSPVAEALRPLPIPAIVPPLILFLGIDDTLKVSVVALAIFFPVLVSTVGGVRNVEQVLLGTGATLQAGAVRTLFAIILPAASPAICSGLRISLSLALITTVVAEMIAGSSGIGYTIVSAQYALRPQEMYAAVLYLMVVGYALNYIFLVLEHRFLFWYGRR